MDIAECFYCKTDMKPGATVCPSCGAYAEETKDEILWYRAGDSHGKQMFRHVFPFALVLAVAIVALLVVQRDIDKTEKEAEEKTDAFLECVLAGGDDC